MDDLNDRKRRGCLAVAAVFLGIWAGIFCIGLVWVQTGRHLSPPSGRYDRAIEGIYAIERETNYQVPEVFREASVTISRSTHGGMQIKGSSGTALQLEEGADGWYFSKNFDPTGPIILPGLSRNWNEGRITASADGLVVEGYMLEKGLMLFVFPFADAASEWSIKLTQTEESDTQSESKQ
ncbi:hypothetical protein [Botrimarina hoheduenensis]|uniref:Uncharacterized protein n=1 Tax=Botrimarina hoheduenensis TaxID=2528000 RepID=A0A5C5WB02_9BACT|nr:hypothetical protein [Botrimarina hoheduenensis]TWT47259.1 hypothetical protein Pla111_08710 [Botrimarina hoheduenensis]